MMSEKSNKIIIFIIISLFLIACFYFFKTNPIEQTNKGELVASVGETKIFDKDLENKIAVEKCYGNENFDKEIALIALINTALEKQVLDNNFPQNTPSKELIKERKEWIDKNTKNVEILNCVKNVYADDEASYLAWYVAPTLENPALYNSFYESKEMNKEEIEKIEKIKKDVDEGKKLSLAEGYEIVSVKKEKSTIPDPLKEYGQESIVIPLIENVLSKMEVGEVWPNIVEDESFYALCEFLEETKDEYKVGSVVVLKKDFEVWFKDFVKNNVQINVMNNDLHQKIKDEYGNVWWTEYLTFISN